MSLPFNEMRLDMDEDLSVQSASIVLYDTITGSKKLRRADSLGKTKDEIINYLDDQKLIKEPGKDSSDQSWTIVFYGSKEKARKWINYDSSLPADKQSKGSTSMPGSANKDTTSTYRRESDSNKSSLGKKNAVRNKYSSNCLTPAEVSEAIVNLHQLSTEILGFLRKAREDYDELKVLLEKTANKREKQEPRVTSLTHEQALLTRIIKEMAIARNDFSAFERKINNLDFDSMGLDEIEQEAIKDALLYDRRVPKLLGTIAKNLFGSKMLTHILGKNGIREREARSHERQFTISKKEEDNLRKILSVFGGVFLTDRAWKAVVQYVINQKGRDDKKPKKRQSTESSNDETQPKKQKTQQEATSAAPLQSTSYQDKTGENDVEIDDQNDQNDSENESEMLNDLDINPMEDDKDEDD